MLLYIHVCMCFCLCVCVCINFAHFGYRLLLLMRLSMASSCAVDVAAGVAVPFKLHDAHQLAAELLLLLLLLLVDLFGLIVWLVCAYCIQLVFIKINSCTFRNRS